MGSRIIQIIRTCNWCDRTPDDGETMWEMGSDGYICEECSDKEGGTTNNPTEAK